MLEYTLNELGLSRLSTAAAVGGRPQPVSPAVVGGLGPALGPRGGRARAATAVEALGLRVRACPLNAASSVFV